MTVQSVAFCCSESIHLQQNHTGQARLYMMTVLMVSDDSVGSYGFVGVLAWGLLMRVVPEGPGGKTVVRWWWWEVMASIKQRALARAVELGCTLEIGGAMGRICHEIAYLAETAYRASWHPPVERVAAYRGKGYLGSRQGTYGA